MNGGATVLLKLDANAVPAAGWPVSKRVNNSEAVVYDPTLIPKGDLAVRITVREGRCEGVG